MSLVVYDKRYSLGQHYCNKIADLIVENNLPVDIYGKTNTDYSSKINSLNMFHIKTEFGESEPYENYAYSIVIEDNLSKSFFSDRPVTSMMCGCMPVYYGCSRMEDYFDDHVIMLTGNLARDMNVIMGILKKPEECFVEIDKNKIRNKMNLLLNVEKLFSS
jgi:uncharacterized CHY-type Zn-finger protein